MNTGEEKFATTQPLAEMNDADRLNREAGLEINDVDKLGERPRRKTTGLTHRW